MVDVVLKDILLGGTIGTGEGAGVGRLVIEGLPVDVERIDGACSAAFRPNAGEGDLVGLPKNPAPLPVVALPLLLGGVRDEP